MAASWVAPPPNEILKKGMAVAGGLSSLARPRKWAGKRGSLHIVGKCGKAAFFHPVRPLSPPHRCRAALCGRPAAPFHGRSAALPAVAAPPYGRSAAVAPRRAPCGCRAVSWSLRGCRRLPLSRRGRGRENIDRAAPRLPRFIFIFVKEISDVDQK